MYIKSMMNYLAGLDFVNDANGTALGTDATAVKVTVAFKDTTDANTAPTEATLDSTNKKKMSLDLSAWVKANQTNKGKDIHRYILCKSK